MLVGDVNIRLDRVGDPNVVDLFDLLASYELTQRVQGITHDAGGTLDVMYARSDLPSTY